MKKKKKENVIINKDEEAVAYWTYLNDKESGSRDKYILWSKRVLYAFKKSWKNIRGSRNFMH